MGKRGGIQSTLLRPLCIAGASSPHQLGIVNRRGVSCDYYYDVVVRLASSLGSEALVGDTYADKALKKIQMTIVWVMFDNYIC